MAVGEWTLPIGIRWRREYGKVGDAGVINRIESELARKPDVKRLLAYYLGILRTIRLTTTTRALVSGRLLIRQ